MPNRDANMRANKQTLVAEFDITDLYMQECSNTNMPVLEEAQKRILNYK